MMKSVELGALWKKKDKNGKQYLTGSINVFPFGQINITIFENSYKTKDNQPDYKLLYTPKEADNKGIVPSDDPEIPF